MKSYLSLERAGLILGDCTEVLKRMPSETFDSLVTDPPAGIGFMGKGWDSDKGGRDQWIAWLAGVMREALRLLKPGAHALVWALPRTSHWTATACEDAGFEVRDVVMHLFGTGFPKSLNAGEGRGTALKPAAEHWILCRKPLVGTVAKNVATYGTGALNIERCRVGTAKVEQGRFGRVIEKSGSIALGGGDLKPTTQSFSEGRFPAHLTLDESAAEALDAQTSELKRGGTLTGNEPGTRDGQVALGTLGPRPAFESYGDSGGASRFFHVTNRSWNLDGSLNTQGPSRFMYCAKPSRAERDVGCEALPVKTASEMTDRVADSKGVENPRAGSAPKRGARNFHPTVKPIALMRWLIRLITPLGGVVLDPFTGSGTTGVAALAEGMRFVGIEMNEEYAAIVRARLEYAHATPDPVQPPEVPPAAPKVAS